MCKFEAPFLDNREEPATMAPRCGCRSSAVSSRWVPAARIPTVVIPHRSAATGVTAAARTRLPVRRCSKGWVRWRSAAGRCWQMPTRRLNRLGCLHPVGMRCLWLEVVYARRRLSRPRFGVLLRRDRTLAQPTCVRRSCQRERTASCQTHHRRGICR